MPIKLGSPVRQKVKPLTGRVMNTEYDPVNQTFKHLIEAPADETGYAHTFYMSDEDLEVDEAQLAKDQEAKAAADAEAAATAAQTSGVSL